MQPVIVIPAYSRSKSLKRLLTSVNKSRFDTKNPPKLIISLDGGADQDVVQVADTFQFQHGCKTVVKRNENLGLEKHILWCGDQAQKYGSAIILEDDLFVDPYFFTYAKKALQFYQHDLRIAGIALYSPRYSQFNKLGFEAMNNGFSSYFMQKVCTWGQAWTAKQWTGFRQWYENVNERQIDANPAIPKTVKNWNSWDKFFSAYMVEKNCYFVYPYISYTTNCADPGGVHMSKGSNRFHVPLGADNRPEKNYSFCMFNDSSVRYDAFMEPEAKEVYDALDLSPHDLEIDIYGIKPLSLLKDKKYVLTIKKCRKPLRVFRLGFRPIEKTILNPVNKFSSGMGYSNHIYFAESKDIISEKRPFYEQIKYACYYMIETKYCFRNLILRFVKKYLNPFGNF